MNDDYQPIDCALHDHLEAAAVTGRRCTLVYLEGQVETRATARIVDLVSQDGVEYMMLDGGDRVRLDQIVSLDGVIFSPPKRGS